MSKVTWRHKKFSQLSLEQLYDMLKLRADVFVVEQNCVYPDLDGENDCLDRHSQTIHLLGYQNTDMTNAKGEQLVAHLRILAKGQSYPRHISIGRVVTATHARGNGLGHELLTKGLTLCQQYFPNEPIKISAQQHLKTYYAKHGFEQVSAMYLEDGIPHIAMIRD
ncbi:GNAT family N-acetyltransferase [Colwellia sp. E2M01]|uniref:GNAT family N-acetyltransferase n=1 Tax=Colwellia sp. E2M01 TaxID=2841561 RepID=UPI001C0891DB|nr:GNAT family N-acetyltransferase [Colwellia sp. E2M01]MBU2872284.1 GNAT family N-acetyltransferase [Colwellia sp. E2M01]